MMPRILVALLLACSTAAWAQSMYRWVDEKGVTHFSETPPPDGAKGATKIEVRPVAPDKAPVDNWKARELESKQRRAAEGTRQENARQQEEAQRARRCSAAQRRADAMTHSARVFRLNDKGERVYLEEDQRARELEEARQEMARSCP